MNTSDKLADSLVDRDIQLDRLKSSMTSGIFAILSDIENDIVSKIAQIDPNGVSAPSYRRNRLNKLLTEVRQIIGNGYSEIAKKSSSDLAAVAATESGFVVSAVNASIGVDMIESGLSPKIIRELSRNTLIEGAKSADWWKTQSSQSRAMFERQMRIGVGQGENIGQLTSRVRKRFPRSVIGRSARHAEAHVRTSVQAVSNASRLRTFIENPSVIKGIQWISTLDLRTSDICIGLSNLTWRIVDGVYVPIDHDKAFPGPTAHWNCRSTQIALTKSWAELSGKNAIPREGKHGVSIQKLFEKELIKQGKSPLESSNIIRQARASMDGEVARETTFREFFDRRSKTEQNIIFGKTKAELFRQGKIDQRDLTDQRNRPRTIEQIQNLN